MEAVCASAARTARDRRLGSLPRIRQSAAAAARARAREVSPVALVAGAVLAEARARSHGRGTSKRRHVEADARRAEHRLAADVRDEARAGAQDRARHSHRARSAGRRVACERQASRRRRPARRQGVQAHRRVVLARLQRHRRSRQARMDRARQGGRDGRDHGAARARGHRPRIDHAALSRLQTKPSVDDGQSEERSMLRNARYVVWTVLAALAGCATPPSTQRADLARIDHVIVLYAENRSFDNLYGLFPGANGLANATPAQYTQVDRDGTPLPHLPPVWKGSTAEADAAFPKDLPNRPYGIDQPPINLPLSVKTRDLIHAFYRNQEQIDGGRNDRFAEASDAGGLVMGHYDGSKLPMWKWAQEYTLADNFFMGAFGGSYLNHMWLICACTPVDPNAPANLRAKLDDRGWLARTPTSPSSVLNGPPHFVQSGLLTPDGYSVNTTQPRYQ